MFTVYADQRLTAREGARMEQGRRVNAVLVHVFDILGLHESVAGPLYVEVEAHRCDISKRGIKINCISLIERNQSSAIWYHIFDS